MATGNDNPIPTKPYTHYLRSTSVSDGGLAYLLLDRDARQFRLAAMKEGIAINFNGYSNPSAEVMRETVEVLRELVAKYDALNGGAK